MKPLLLFFFFFLSVAGSLPALEIPPAPESRINDYAAMFSSQSIAQLHNLLSDYEAQTHQKIIIATFYTLKGENIEDFSTRLAQRWQIGTSGHEGVLIVIIKHDRFVRIRVSPGLARKLNENQNFQIVANHIVPNFRKGDYDKGIKDTVSVIINYLQDPGQPKKGLGNRQSKFFLVGVIILSLLLLGLFIYKAKGKVAVNNDEQ